ncbi:MAG: putative PEP-binding protein [Lactococcus raffinolactis]
MFFGETRILNMRKLILSSEENSRAKALATLKTIQKEDFKAIFNLVRDKPVTVRLLDPPLHEFLPHSVKEIEILATELNLSVTEIKQRIESLSEVNPMLGHRGCRLAVTFPEIYRLQAQAITESVIALKQEAGGDPKSIQFYNAIGLDYVSCSPYRVPIARISAAQAEIRAKNQDTESETMSV